MPGDISLQHLVRHEEAGLRSAPCSCCRCLRMEAELDPAAGGQGGKRQRRKKARRRRARQFVPAPGATPAGAGGSVLPGWLGWSPPVRLSTLLRLGSKVAKARKSGRSIDFVPARLRPFLQKGHALYRVSTPGSDNRQPLTIGQLQQGNSVAGRMRQHAGRGRTGARKHGVSSGGDPKATAALQGLDPRKVLVQMGRVSRPDIDARLMHAYEIWLQNRERIRLYEPSTRTFEQSAATTGASARHAA